MYIDTFVYSSKTRGTMLLNTHVAPRNSSIFICDVYTFGSNGLLECTLLGGLDLRCTSGIVWFTTFHSFIGSTTFY